jgi:hypothetical protein
MSKYTAEDGKLTGNLGETGGPLLSGFPDALSAPPHNCKDELIVMESRNGREEKNGPILGIAQ